MTETFYSRSCKHFIDNEMRKTFFFSYLLAWGGCYLLSFNQFFFNFSTLNRHESELQTCNGTQGTQPKFSWWLIRSYHSWNNEGLHSCYTLVYAFITLTYMHSWWHSFHSFVWGALVSLRVCIFHDTFVRFLTLHIYFLYKAACFFNLLTNKDDNQ